MRWHKDMLRGFRDNAAYEAGRYMILALLAAVWPTINGVLHVLWSKPWYWKLNGTLIGITAILLIAALWKFSRIGKAQRLRTTGLLSSDEGHSKESDFHYPNVMARLRRHGVAVVPLEDRKLTALKQQLANKIEKGKRLDVTPESTGFDIPGAIRRNQRHISELLAEIKRLEGEQSKPSPIECAKSGLTTLEIIDGLINEGEKLAASLTGFETVGSQKLHEPWIKSVHDTLRERESKYLPMFNEARPYTGSYLKNFALTVDAGKWMEDKERRFSWETVMARLDVLRKIRGQIRSKLPS